MPESRDRERDPSSEIFWLHTLNPACLSGAPFFHESPPLYDGICHSHGVPHSMDRSPTITTDSHYEGATGTLPPPGHTLVAIMRRRFLGFAADGFFLSRSFNTDGVSRLLTNKASARLAFQRSRGDPLRSPRLVQWAELVHAFSPGNCGGPKPIRDRSGSAPFQSQLGFPRVVSRFLKRLRLTRYQGPLLDSTAFRDFSSAW